MVLGGGVGSKNACVGVGVGVGKIVATRVGSTMTAEDVGVGRRGELGVTEGSGVGRAISFVGEAVACNSSPLGDVHAANRAAAPTTTVAIRSMRASLDSNSYKSTD